MTDGDPPIAARLAAAVPRRFRLPWRYALFLLLCASAVPLLAVAPPASAIMAGFDIAALVFMASLVPLYRHDPDGVRAGARRNDANREVMLLLTGIVMTAVLVSIAAEMTQRGMSSPATVALIVATLLLAWLFSNTVYALHYAYLYYGADATGGDAGGIDFPGEGEPDYWDFTYFAYTLGMTFQTSDVPITAKAVRKVVIFHGLAAFIFNLGIIAFSINVLGGG